MSFKPSLGFRQLTGAQAPSLLPRSGRGECLSHVLRSYEFTPRDRIILSYAIARAYWQLYDSEFMRTKWTGENIWFMPEEDEGSSPHQLPLRSYLSFPFSPPGNNPLQDIVRDAPLTHQFPRILAIGLLLLQIGLSKPLPPVRRRNEISQTNFEYMVAKSQLKELKRLKWEGFENKTYFDEAVGYCLDGSKFVVNPRTASHKTSKAASTETMDGSDEIVARRKIFYRHVVRPLAWLANKGFGSCDKRDTTHYIQRSNGPSTSEAEGGMLQPEASFHSGKPAVAQNWLRDLKAINAQIEIKRRKEEVRTRPIRVAILDTGFDASLPSLRLDSSKMACIIEKRDFVDPSNAADPSNTAKDTFGHGTFMARLVMECAPSAEIIIARVAKSTKALDGSEKRVEEVSTKHKIALAHVQKCYLLNREHVRLFYGPEPNVRPTSFPCRSDFRGYIRASRMPSRR